MDEKRFFHRTSEIEAVRAMEETITHLRAIDDNPYNLKWTTCAFHNALMGYMALAIPRTSRGPLLSRSGFKQWNNAWTANDVRKLMGDFHVSSFPDLLEKVKSPDIMQTVLTGKTLELTDKEDEWMTVLNDVRSRLSHFDGTEVYWEVAMFLPMFEYGVRVIEKLIACQTMVYVEREYVYSHTGEHIKELRALLEQLQHD